MSGAISRDTAATVSVTVENTVSRAGDEVVQLYLRQDYTSVTRPVKELEGFQRIMLQPGEKREASFLFGFEQIKFWKDSGWVAEPGKIRLMVGSSSADIRLEGEIESKIQ